MHKFFLLLFLLLFSAQMLTFGSGYFSNRVKVMRACPGKKDAGRRSCGGVLYMCKFCNAAGCDQRECANTQFQALKCMNCGRPGRVMAK